MVPGSKDTAKAAVRLAMSSSRDEEKLLKARYAEKGVKVAAVDFGGEFVPSIMKIIESTIVAAKREKIIEDVFHEEGAVAGAVREALTQIHYKALGLNVGGKIGIARFGEHIAVTVFFGIGLVHLNEVSIGLGHRVI